MHINLRAVIWVIVGIVIVLLVLGKLLWAVIVLLASRVKKRIALTVAEKHYKTGIAKLDKEYNELWNNSCKDLGLPQDSELPEETGNVINKYFDDKYGNLQIQWDIEKEEIEDNDPLNNI